MFQISFLAEASDHAILGADGAWVWVGACGWASGSARVEDFVIPADRWHHHELDQVHFRAHLHFHAFATFHVADVAVFACATRYADTWANWVLVVAGAIATFAHTIFFIVTSANWGFHGWHHGVVWRISEEHVVDWNLAFFNWDANALFVLQES